MAESGHVVNVNNLKKGVRYGDGLGREILALKSGSRHSRDERVGHRRRGRIMSTTAKSNLIRIPQNAYSGVVAAAYAFTHRRDTMYNRVEQVAA